MRTKNLTSVMDSAGRYFFSPAEVRGFHDVSQDNPPIPHKPNGLWYACGDGWLKWVHDSAPRLANRWSYLYQIEPSDSVLSMSSLEDVSVFHNRFAKRSSWPWSKTDPIHSFIDWKKVAAVFPGVEICPYEKDLLREPVWYGIWDVASGCIWSTRGVQGMRPIARRTEGDNWTRM